MRIWLVMVLILGVLHAGVESPRLARLEKELSGDALEAFWVEVGESGAPLIEAHDEESSLVTFVYRGRGDEERVVLLSGVCPCDPVDCQMHRLGGTDLWFRSHVVDNGVRTTYRFSVNGSLMAHSKVSLEEFLEMMSKDMSNWRTDPFNGQGGSSYSVLEMPDAPDLRWARKYEDACRGAVAAHKLDSEIMGNKRKMLVYVPPHYSVDADPYPLVVLFDGRDYDQIVKTPVILDNLIGAGKIRPCVAVLVCNASQASRYEELPCNPTFGRFIVEEVLPWVDDHYNVSRHAHDVVVGGASFGGLCAAYLALEYPECFGNVLSQSGAFWWKPAEGEAPSWLIQQYLEREPVAVKFHLDAGSLETMPFFGGPSMLQSNLDLRDVLLEKGYSVTYNEFNGGHDYICWKGSLPDGLIALLGVED